MFESKKIIVIGSGVAGLTCALSLIENGYKVTIITKAKTSDSATWYAQGGVASVMFDDDTIDSHVQDTLDAGAGLCNEEAVKTLVTGSTHALELLISRGAQFDKLADGSYARTREGGHHNDRIIHAGGDATGEEIERSLVKVAANKSMDNLSILDFHMVTKLLVEDDRCVGVECVDAELNKTQISADAVVLATGGAGQLFAVTTNPLLATGDGIALALDAGVICADLEFMQFHPTGLHVDNMPRPLLSEALRGEGAILRDENGKAFMDGVHELKDLAPRDIVSREIATILLEHEVDHVYLDATNIPNFSRRFPTIFASCELAQLDPSKEFMPVSPAAHYFCGGVVTDINGSTSLRGLYAAGEVACNGVHGANRLASNSLLDGLVFGQRVANSIANGITAHDKSGMFSYLTLENTFSSDPTDTDKTRGDATQRTKFQKLMSRNVGVLRDGDLLEEADKELKIYSDTSDNGKSLTFEDIEMSYLLQVAGVMIKSAIARKESRGCHSRKDFNQVQKQYRGHFFTAASSKDPKFVSLDIEK